MSEKVYLELLNDVLTTGSHSEDRTGCGTIRSFAKMMKFDISNSFPLLTTKKMAWKSIAHELFWFLSGDTNLKYLQDNKVRIWDGNYLDFVKRRKEKGMETVEGDCGNIYGKQWRNFEGIDQIARLISEIKQNPQSRRLLVSAWNPKDVDPNISCLPPCHVLFQFFVDGDHLSCALYQRSADLFLGVPFNIASYSMLTYMVAQVCGLKPKEFTHFIGDCHIYKNHIEQVKEQLTRAAFPLPKLNVKNRHQTIFEFELSDFEIEGYESHPAIKAEMAV